MASIGTKAGLLRASVRAALAEALESRCLLAVTPFRWAGEADPTTSIYTAPSSASWSGVAVQTDGRPVVVGAQDGFSRVWRFTASGGPDPAFNLTGQVSIDFAAGSEGFNNVLIEPDGRILVSGAYTNNTVSPSRPVGAYARLNPDGTMDPSFGGGDGIETYPLSDNWSAGAPARLASGKYLVYSIQRRSLLRLNENGSIDTTYGNAGWLLLPDSAQWSFADVHLLPDGSFYAAGRRDISGGSSSVARMARYFADGQLDPSFGVGGVVEFSDTAGIYDKITESSLLPDNTLLVASDNDYLNEQNEHIEVLELRHYLADGSLDPAFAQGGKLDVSAYFKGAESIEADSHGRIVVAGEPVLSAGADVGNRGLVRLTPTGAFDPSFGIGGRAIERLDFRIALEADDDIVGISSTRALKRVLGEPRGDGPAYLDTGSSVLYITGTPAADQISLTASGSDLAVAIGAASYTFPLSSVTSFTLDGRLGSDQIIYDVGDAFAGVTNTIDAGPVSYLINPPIGANTVEVRSGPASGTLRFTSATTSGYSTAVTVGSGASADVTVDATNILVTLMGTDGDDLFDWSTNLTVGSDSTIHGRVIEVSGNDGDDVFRGRASSTSSSAPRFIGGAGNDLLDAVGGTYGITGGAGVDRVLCGPPATTPTNATGYLSDRILSHDKTSVDYLEVERVTLVGSAGKDTFTVRGTAANVSFDADFAGGDDAIVVGSTTESFVGALRQMFGLASLNLGSGADTLTVNDTPLPPSGASPAPRPAHLTVTDSTIIPDDLTLFGNSAAVVTYVGAETISFVGGGAADSIAVVPSAQSTFTINGAGPTTLPGDALTVRLSGALGVVPTSTGADSGNYTFANRLAIQFSKIERNVLAVDAGTYEFATDVGAAMPTVELLVQNAHADFTSPQTLGAIQLAAGGSVTVAAGGNNTILTRAISIAQSPGTWLDLTDNDLVLNYTGASPIGSWNGSGYMGVTALLASGSNGGNWNGDGIRSSAADVSGYYTLGIGEASQVFGLTGAQTMSWSGKSIDSTTVLIKHTYGGDANLDGVVDVDDYGALDFSWAAQGVGVGYLNGDLNFDGLVNADDYAMIDFVLNIQGPPL